MRLPRAGMALDFGGLGKEYAAERDGVRYCHVLDPRTGMPVRHWRSVTVVAPVAVAAGGYTTIAMLLEAGAAAHLEATGLPWLAVGPDGSIVSSPGAA